MFVNKNTVNQVLNQFLEQSLSDVFGVDVLSSTPSVNIHESADSHILELAIPGVQKEEVVLQVENRVLEIKANQKDLVDKNNQNFQQKNYVKQEFRYSDFSRKFKLPPTADEAKIKAEYQSGILTITIDKKEDSIDKGPIMININ
jgi:HSP20 family protein